MLDLLQDFLANNAAPEDTQAILMADRVLQRADMEYEHVIEEILQTQSEMDAGQPLLEITNIYQRCLNTLLDWHAIKLVEPLPIQQKAEIVNGLLDIDNLENPTSFFKIIDEEAKPIEKLSLMLSQVTHWNVDQLMQTIEDVTDTFFSRLKDTDQALAEDDPNELVEQRERTHAYRKFDIYLSSVGGAIIQIPSMLAQGMQVGLTYELYAKLIDGRQPLLSMSFEQVARELFAAALISCDGFGNPGETVKQSLEEFLPDLKMVSNVMIEIRQLTMGYAK